MKTNLQYKKFSNLFVVSLFFLFVTIVPQLYAQGAGNCLNFDGSDDYVDCGNDASVNITGSITFEAWVKPTGIRTNSIIKKYENVSPYHGYEFYIDGSGYPTIRLSNNTSSRITLASSIQVVGGSWVHIAATYNVGNRNMSIYVNGVLAGTLTGTGPTAIASASSTNLSIGSELPIVGSKVFFGRIDEARIWNVARTQTEIQDNMCKKLLGDETGLVGYWRLDETSGISCTDQSGNGNTGTMTNMILGTERETSEAAIGDASVGNYSSPTTVNLASLDGDDLTIDNITGSPTGVQIYRVDSAPNVTAVTGGESAITQLSQYHYFGVFVIGGSSPTYTATYNYLGHPGIDDESFLDLAKRTNLTSTWTEMDAALLQDPNTLTLAGLSDLSNQIILGSEGTNALPVELSSFTASTVGKNILLNWKTETEVNNYGFEIHRQAHTSTSLSVTGWEKIGFVNGNGNTNSPKDYSFVDENVTNGKYVYRLKQIDNDGQFEYSKIVEVSFGSPEKFELSQNYPNPFNPSTTIKFAIPQSGNVKLTVYNILGEQISQLINEFREAGVHTVNFRASNYNSGLYLYKLESNGLVQTRKMLLVK